MTSHRRSRKIKRDAALLFCSDARVAFFYPEFNIVAFVFIAVCIIALMLFVAVSFNRLVRCTKLVDEAFSGIDVQLKRRHDLIPNLVQCVQGYTAFESSLLEDVVTARSTTIAATEIARLNVEENGLTANSCEIFHNRRVVS